MTSVTVEWSGVPLGVLAVRGPDARRFLHGQLSIDVLGLRPGQLRWSGCHNPQGRALALPRLCCDGDDVLALLPPELIAPLLLQLRRYVLRAKVALADESAAWQAIGVFSPPAALAALGAHAAPLPANPAATRSLLVLRADETTDWLAPAAQRGPAHWRRQDIADGLPQVYAATSGRFVAQMLNLDLIGGIAFDKGCYTGQEVIARAHYRGRIKRRMQRFYSAVSHAADWPPGAMGELPDGRRFEVVDSIDLEGGGTEFLAVTGTITAAASEADSRAQTVSAAGAEPSVALCVDASPRALPYALP